jgi:hypothetical protein
MKDGLSCTASAGVRSIAIHPVLGDVDVEAAQIDGTKLVYPVVNLMKLILLVGFPALLNKLLKPGCYPSVGEGEIAERVFCRIKVVEIPEQDS